jgi:Mg2+/citrate symporter
MVLLSGRSVSVIPMYRDGIGKVEGVSSCFMFFIIFSGRSVSVIPMYRDGIGKVEGVSSCFMFFIIFSGRSVVGYRVPMYREGRRTDFFVLSFLMYFRGVA